MGSDGTVVEYTIHVNIHIYVYVGMCVTCLIMRFYYPVTSHVTVTKFFRPIRVFQPDRAVT